MSSFINKALEAGSDAELFVIKQEDYPVVFEANKLKSVNSKLLESSALRIIKDGRVGFAACTGKPGESLIQSAADASLYGPEANFSFWSGTRFPSPEVFHPEIVRFEMEDAEHLGRRMVKRMQEVIPEVYADVHMAKSFREIQHVTASGERVYYKTLFLLYVTALLVREGELLYINESSSGCRLPENPMSLIGEILWKEKLSRKTVETSSGKIPVIFTPKVVPELLEAFVSGLSGKSVVSKASPLTDRVGEQILDERFSLYDDPLIDFGTASSPFDDEGIPRHRFPLFHKGILKNYILDLASAAALDKEPTASAQRGFLTAPVPAPSNLQVEAGEVSYDDMVADMEEGLIVDQVIGGGQSNLLGGEFSVNVELGFLVKKGRITGRVRNTMVAGNVYELFKNNLLAIGKDSFTEGSVISPHLMFKDVSVSGKG